MPYTYDDLKTKSLADLQEIANSLEGNDAIKGHSQLNKAHLLPALCNAFHIDTHQHHLVVGIDKVDIKSRMRELKAERAAALDAHDGETLKAIRRQFHKLNHQIRSHISAH